MMSVGKCILIIAVKQLIAKISRWIVIIVGEKSDWLFYLTGKIEGKQVANFRSENFRDNQICFL